MNYKILVFGILIGLVLGATAGYFIFSSLQKEVLQSKLKICPDGWFKNKMPCACVTSNCSECNNSPSEYFTLNGKIRQLSEFDIDWVNKTCNITAKIVY